MPLYVMFVPLSIRNLHPSTHSFQQCSLKSARATRKYWPLLVHKHLELSTGVGLRMRRVCRVTPVALFPSHQRQLRTSKTVYFTNPRPRFSIPADFPRHKTKRNVNVFADNVISPFALALLPSTITLPCRILRRLSSPPLLSTTY